MAQACPLRPGCAYSFWYPAHNYAGIPSQHEIRRVRVVSVRDTSREPLDKTTAELNPTLLRGRWLVTGQDIDKGAERSFYAESMTNVRELSPDDLQPLQRATSFVVVGQSSRVEFQSERLSEAMAFMQGRRAGVLCGVLSISPQVPLHRGRSNRENRKKTARNGHQRERRRTQQ